MLKLVPLGNVPILAAKEVKHVHHGATGSAVIPEREGKHVAPPHPKTATTPISPGRDAIHPFLHGRGHIFKRIAGDNEPAGPRPGKRRRRKNVNRIHAVKVQGDRGRTCGHRNLKSEISFRRQGWNGLCRLGVISIVKAPGMRVYEKSVTRIGNSTPKWTSTSPSP